MSGGDQDNEATSTSEQIADIAQEISTTEISSERAEEISQQLEDIATELRGDTEHPAGNA